MTNYTTLNLPKLLATFAATLALLVTILGGVFFPGYSHTRDYISELGASGTITGVWVSYLGFLPIGLLLAAFLITASPLLSARGWARVGFYLLYGAPLGYISSAFAPCDLGCPVEGSLSQQIHSLLGLPEYIGGGLGLLLFAGSYFKEGSDKLGRLLIAGAGVFTLLGLLLMMFPANAGHMGLNQRIAEIALFGGMLVIAWRCTSTSKTG